MENHFQDLVRDLEPTKLEALAMSLHEMAKQKTEASMAIEEEKIKLEKLEKVFDKKVQQFDKSLAKYDELVSEGERQLEDLRESRVRTKKDASQKVFSDTDLEKSKGGFWDSVLKKPMQDFEFGHLDSNIEKLEGSLERLKATQEKISKERGLLISVHNQEETARKEAAASQTERNLQIESCQRLGIIARSYLVAESSIGRLRELSRLVKTKQWEQHCDKLGVGNHKACTQLFGSVLAPGRIDTITFMPLIAYLSDHNFMGDKYGSEAYARIIERDVGETLEPEQFGAIGSPSF